MAELEDSARAGIEPRPDQPYPAPLGVETRADAPGGPVIAVSGDLDISSVEQLRSAVSEVADAHPEELTFDMSGLRFMDSAGIAVLLVAAGKVPSVRLYKPTTAVRRVIELTGLTEVLKVES